MTIYIIAVASGQHPDEIQRTLCEICGDPPDEIDHRLAIEVARALVPSPADIGTSIRNKLSSGTSYEEDVAEYDRKQVQSGVERVPEEPTE